LRDYIDGILKFYKSDDIIKDGKTEIQINHLLEELKRITDSEHKVRFNISSDVQLISANETALMQILINLITNAIKYNSKPEIIIDIVITEEESFYNFVVKDNGDGIPKNFLDKIFDLFTVVGVEDRDGNVGTGIGLATVKKIVRNLGGAISVTSTEGVGSTFTFSISKI
ncbi:sensor histidine kinase, partial [Aquimarina sp. BL5]